MAALLDAAATSAQEFGQMTLALAKIDYHDLNSRQKENFNFMKLSALLADFGYTTMRLSDDWGGADFIAVHIDGSSLKVQLKGRLLIDSKYLGKGIYIAFRDGAPQDGTWYLYPHDEMLTLLSHAKGIDKTRAWMEAESYHYPRLSEDLLRLLKPYEVSGDNDSTLRPIPKSWLVRRLKQGDDGFAEPLQRFKALMIDGDEVWFYDEPMPPDVLAGELGLALVRHGTPIHAEMTGVH